MINTPDFQLGTAPARVIHPKWNDQAFGQFGLKIGEKNAPLSPEQLMDSLTGAFAEDIKALLAEYGFLVFQVKGFSPKNHSSLPWEYIANHPHRLEELNMLPHTDFVDILLFNPGNRECATSISGRTGIAEALFAQVRDSRHLPSHERLTLSELRYQLLPIIEQGSEYDEADPLTPILAQVHLAINDLFAFEKSQCWRFIHHLQQSIRSKVHRHVWKGDQVLLISEKALHYREVPREELLIESSGIWRAQIAGE